MKMTKQEARGAFKKLAQERLRMVEPKSLTVSKYRKDGYGPELYIRVVLGGPFSYGEVTVDTADSSGRAQLSFTNHDGFGGGDLEQVFRWLREVLDNGGWQEMLPYGVTRIY